MSALIGALRVSLSAETAQFEAGMKRAQRTANQTNSAFKKSFGGLGGIVKAGFAGVISGVSLGLIAQGAKAALEYAGSLGEVAQQLGVTTKELQVFRYAVQQNGGTLEQADKALGKFATSISQARSGSEQMAKTFKAVGVELADLETKSKSEILGQIADEMKRTGGASANAAAGVKIFGKDFKSIVPTLDLGSKGLSAVAQAAEDLGIILDDKLIDQADEASDKVDALQTVLKAQIAGAVAQNSSAIVDLANSLVYLVSKIAGAIRAWNDFKNALDAQAFDLASKNPFLSAAKRKEGADRAARARGKISDSGVGWNVAGSKVTKDLTSGGKARELALKMGLKIAEPKAPSAELPQFLAPSGGGGKGRSGSDDAERKRQEALRAAFQFDQELLRAQQDVLRAQQQLSTDYSERAALSIQMLNLEQQGFQREMEYAVASGDLTKAQAAQLEAEFAKRDQLERQAVLKEEETQRYEDYNRLDQADLDIQRGILESQEQLAETAGEQREIRLRILDLDYRAERARLATVLADENASWAAKEEARRRMAALDKMQANDTQAVKNNTRGPLGDYLNSLPTTAEKWNEALQQVAVNGLQSVEDGLISILDGTKSVGEAFKDMARSIINDLLRIAIRRMIIAPIANALFPGGMSEGGLAGYASGGWVSGPGTSKSDSIPAMLSNGEFVVNAKSAKQFMPLLERINDGSISTLAMGGLPIARVSHGERVNISNDNGGRGGGSPVSISFAISGPVTRETQMQIAAAARRGIASANRKGI